MSCAPQRSVSVDETLAYEWAYESCAAAEQVPAGGEEAVDWTVRGWAEVALGCAVSDTPDALRGLDDAIRRSAVPCRGPFAQRLRALRRRAGEPPSWYFGDESGGAAQTVGPDARTVRSCLLLAEFCDALTETVEARHRDRKRTRSAPPPWTGTGDHLRWGERLRPRPSDYPYLVLRTTVEQHLAWRTWLFLPTVGGPRIALIDPLRARSGASMRQRVCHGIHNGAHLDHLGALVAEKESAARAAAQAGAGSDSGSGSGTWTSLPIEFGEGLLVAESFAMAVELLAAVQCLLAGLPAEARVLAGGFAERIGRLPGYRVWYEREGRARGSATLDAAARIAVREFATLPTLAANYVTGPLRLLAAQHRDPLLPVALHSRFKRRWDEAAARFPAATLLAERAGAEAG
jgi:hypothetical protein